MDKGHVTTDQLEARARPLRRRVFRTASEGDGSTSLPRTSSGQMHLNNSGAHFVELRETPSYVLAVQEHRPAGCRERVHMARKERDD